MSFWLAAVIGFLTAVVCASLQNLNDWMHIDEGLEVFKLHAIGGMMGSFLTGIFADQTISALDGGSLYPGGVNGVGIQVGKQFAEITAISAYSFVVTGILLLILKYIPGLGLRVSKEAEMRGLDLDQFFDEQIGDWNSFEPFDGNHQLSHGTTTIGHDPVGSAESSMNPVSPKAEEDSEQQIGRQD